MIIDLIVNITSVALIGLFAATVQTPPVRGVGVQFLVAAYACWLVARSYQKASK